MRGSSGLFKMQLPRDKQLLASIKMAKIESVFMSSKSCSHSCLLQYISHSTDLNIGEKDSAENQLKCDWKVWLCGVFVATPFYKVLNLLLRWGKERVTGMRREVRWKQKGEKRRKSEWQTENRNIFTLNFHLDWFHTQRRRRNSRGGKMTERMSKKVKERTRRSRKESDSTWWSRQKLRDVQSVLNTRKGASTR